MSVIDLSAMGFSGGAFGDAQRRSMYALAANAAAISRDFSASIYGTSIPLSQGKRALTGVPIWFGPLVATRLSYTSGQPPASDGAPGGLGAVTMYTRWSRNCAVAFGYNLAPSGQHSDPQVRRIWINGSLAYDMSAPGTLMSAAALLAGLKFTLYPGNETQNVDPLIFADKGTLASPNRGMIYMVFQDLTMGHDTAYSGPAWADGTSQAWPNMQAAYGPSAKSYKSYLD